MTMAGRSDFVWSSKRNAPTVAGIAYQHCSHIIIALTAYWQFKFHHDWSRNEMCIGQTFYTHPAPIVLIPVGSSSGGLSSGMSSSSGSGSGGAGGAGGGGWGLEFYDCVINNDLERLETLVERHKIDLDAKFTEVRKKNHLDLSPIHLVAYKVYVLVIQLTLSALWKRNTAVLMR